MPDSLFSTYSQGENRVTSTIMSVLEHIDDQLEAEILNELTDGLDLLPGSFDHQVRGRSSGPDVAIRTSMTIWLDTKKNKGGITTNQIEQHRETLENDNAEFQRLIILTPDKERPAEVRKVGDERIVWANFETLVEAVEAIRKRESENEHSSDPSQREMYLLRELNRFIEDEELVSGKQHQVLVVAARKAWPEYQRYRLYFCKPNRSFRPVSHLAFYTNRHIKKKVPKKIGEINRIQIREEAISSNKDLSKHQRKLLLDAVENMPEQDEFNRFGNTQKVIFLEDDIELDQPIKNDKTARNSDQRVPFVQGHRYVPLSKLRQNPKYTTELEGPE